jgi:hypothetical protein
MSLAMRRDEHSSRVGLQKGRTMRLIASIINKYNINTMRFWVLMLRLLFRRMMRLGKYSTSYWI